MLEFTRTSCLQFTYRKYSPALLDVFLALSNGSVITILDRNRNKYGDVPLARTIQRGAGKVPTAKYVNSLMDLFTMSGEKL